MLPPLGMQLTALTQSTALKLIRRTNEQHPTSRNNRKTATNLKLVQQTLEDYIGSSPSATTIWTTIQ